MCRDVDDPEYKPAPALLKDEMEVRPTRTNQLKDLFPEYIRVCSNVTYDDIYHCLTSSFFLMQDDASSPGDLVVTDNAGGEN